MKPEPITQSEVSQKEKNKCAWNLELVNLFVGHQERRET